MQGIVNESFGNNQAEHGREEECCLTWLDVSVGDVEGMRSSKAHQLKPTNEVTEKLSQNATHTCTKLPYLKIVG